MFKYLSSAFLLVPLQEQLLRQNLRENNLNVYYIECHTSEWRCPAREVKTSFSLQNLYTFAGFLGNLWLLRVV